MCRYCEENETLKSSNFCGSAKAQILGHYLDIYGDEKKFNIFKRIYRPGFNINYCPMCRKEAGRVKVIFLDIDGVLNNSKHLTELMELLGRKQYFSIINQIHETPFDYRSCKLLQELIKETEAEIVLSSTWRLNDNGIEIIEQYAGISIRDTTPVLNTIRGEEIKQYLDNHQEITEYIILDDDTDMLKEQMGHLVKVNNQIGFTITEYIQCRNILNNLEEDK